MNNDERQLQLWLMNDPVLYYHACSVRNFTEFAFRMVALRVGSVAGYDMEDCDIDTTQLDAEWADCFPASEAR